MRIFNPDGLEDDSEDRRDPYIRVLFRLEPGIWDCWDEEGFYPENLEQPIRHILLWAANLAHADICNGGFDQFFRNPTGRLAPEGVTGFELLKLFDSAKVIEEAMNFFGEPYVRNDDERIRLLEMHARFRKVSDPFTELNNRFYATLRNPDDQFRIAANEYTAEFDDSER